jgi:3D (Asp-Asp-Asp) domain-containing protein
VLPRSQLLAAGTLAAAALLAAVPALAAGAGTGTTLTMEATAYGPTAQDNYPYGAVDYFGRPLVKGDIAVDPSVIPLKTCLYVTGYRSPNLPAGGYIGEADDEGGAIKGDHVDLFMNTTEAQVNNFGIQTVKVTLLGPATNPSAAGTAACAGYSVPGSGNAGGNQGNPSGPPGGGASGGTGPAGRSHASGHGGRGYRWHRLRHRWGDRGRRPERGRRR